jgi:hypothetical protein
VDCIQEKVVGERLRSSSKPHIYCDFSMVIHLFLAIGLGGFRGDASYRNRWAGCLLVARSTTHSGASSIGYAITGRVSLVSEGLPLELFVCFFLLVPGGNEREFKPRIRVKP